MTRPRKLFAIMMLLGLVSCAVVGTTEKPGSPKIERIGESNWMITTRSPEAQAWFNQGMQLIYAFDQEDAARAFQAALNADADCAMCAWGLAYANGPNINNNNPEDRKISERWQKRAERLAANATSALTALESALIRAASGRYVSVTATEKTKDDVAKSATETGICSTSEQDPAPEFDVVYAAQMEAVYREFGTHADVATLYADAQMVLDAWYWWSKAGKPTGATEKAIAALDAILKTSPQHTGANHLLVHVMEESPTPERAMAAADLLRTLAPGAPHLLHMPSHIDIKTGRFADATIANQLALQADTKRVDIVTAQGFSAKRSWSTHHLHFLQYAAMMEGRSEVAIDAAKRLAARFTSKDVRDQSKSPYAQYMRAVPILNQARFEKWDDVLTTPMPATKQGLEEALTRYAKGLAHVGRNDHAAAQAELTTLRELAKMEKNIKAKTYGRQTVASFMEILVNALDGQIQFRRANESGGIDALKRAAAAEDAIDGQDPPMLGAQMRILLARALLQSGRAPEAEQTARDALKAVRGSGWALDVLHESLVVQKKTTEAAEVQKALQQAWPQADVGLMKKS
jgi:tetratricopeptide (TPR) repeat protein